jgi:hypothetical protein
MFLTFLVMRKQFPIVIKFNLYILINMFEHFVLADGIFY